MKKVCIVGYGTIGPVHGHALEHVEQAQLYAVCDINPEARKRCSDQYSVVEYDDFDTMLEDECIDSIHICTPHHLHFEMIQKALAKGKEVVVEKPLTRTKEELELLMQLEHKEKVCVVLQNRLNPCVQKMKELLDSGDLGALIGVRSFVTWKRDASYYKRDDWRGKWDTEGGGLLINQAIHTLDYYIYLLGGMQSVQAQMSNYTLKDVIEVEDTFSAFFQLKGNVRGIFFATNAYPENSTPLFEVKMEQGTLRYMDRKLWLNDHIICEDTRPDIGRDYWGNSHGLLIKRYYDEHTYFGVADAYDTMRTVFAMYESAKTMDAIYFA